MIDLSLLKCIATMAPLQMSKNFKFKPIYPCFVSCFKDRVLVSSLDIISTMFLNFNRLNKKNICKLHIIFHVLGFHNFGFGQFEVFNHLRFV